MFCEGINVKGQRSNVKGQTSKVKYIIPFYLLMRKRLAELCKRKSNCYRFIGYYMIYS